MQGKLKPSVFTFFILVFVLSIPFWVLGSIYPVQLLPGLPISALGAFIPALAALILAYRQSRSWGALQLLKRSFDFKRIRNRNWYVAILLINPLVAVLAYGVMIAAGSPLPNPTPWTLAILPMFVFFFLGALGEELGWTGYATEPLQDRWGMIGASILLGAVWSAWHFLPLMQAHRSAGWIAWWSLDTVSLRLIMTWLYMRSGKSVFAAALFHAMINLSWQLFPGNGSAYDPRVFGLLTFSFAVMICAAQWFFGTKKLSAARH